MAATSATEAFDNGEDEESNENRASPTESLLQSSLSPPTQQQQPQLQDSDQLSSPPSPTQQQQQRLRESDQLSSPPPPTQQQQQRLQESDQLSPPPAMSTQSCHSSLATDQPPTLLPYRPYLHPPQLVTDTVGFLLSHFQSQWANTTATRIQAVATIYPDAWQRVQNGIDDIVHNLEQGTSILPKRLRSNIEEGEEDQEANVEDQISALGAAPVLKDWKCGWWAVQGIGATATLTNEVTERMDPRRHKLRVCRRPMKTSSEL